MSSPAAQGRVGLLSWSLFGCEDLCTGQHEDPLTEWARASPSSVPLRELGERGPRLFISHRVNLWASLCKLRSSPQGPGLRGGPPELLVTLPGFAVTLSDSDERLQSMKHVGLEAVAAAERLRWRPRAWCTALIMVAPKAAPVSFPHIELAAGPTTQGDRG